MKFSAKQIFVALASLVITLGALFAGQRLYHTAVVEKPLANQLGSIIGVRQAYLQGGNLIVRLKPKSNLMTVYQRVTANAALTLGHVPSQIEIIGKPNNSLKSLANNMAFVVAQGEATGQFVAMKGDIQSLAARAGASARVELDPHHLYLTLKEGHHILYDVIPLSIGGPGHA